MKSEPVLVLSRAITPCPFTSRGWWNATLLKKDVISEKILSKRRETKAAQDHVKGETGYVKRKKTRSGLNPFAEGRFFAHYSVGELLGTGAFGTVYAGIRKKDNKNVAIKRILKEFSEYVPFPGDNRSLPLEVALMKLVCKPPLSPYVIELLEWFETDMAFILIMERPEPSVTLHKYCTNLSSTIPDNQAQSIMRQLVKALCHCHSRGVFHRDMKLDNVLLNPHTMELKLIDFGYGCMRKNTTYTESGEKSVIFPSEWIAADEKRKVSATIRELGLLLLGVYCGGAINVFEEDLLYIKEDLPQACYNLIRWCLEGDPKKQPTLEQILTHEWFKGQIMETKGKIYRKA